MDGTHIIQSVNTSQSCKG